MRKHFISFLVIMLAAGVLASTALAQGGVFSGTVVDDDDNPFEGAAVVMELEGASPPRIEATTDSNGRFSMLGLNTGSWEMTVSAEGFSPYVEMISISQSTNPAWGIKITRIKHALELALGAEALGGVDPDAITEAFAAADAAYNNEQWEQALSGYRAILEQLPVMSNLNLQIGSALRQLGQYDEAIATFELAAVGDPALEQTVQTEIGRTRMAMGDFEAAGTALESAASGDGANREDLYNLGELEFAKGNMELASGWYEKSAAIDPTWGKPLFKLALVALNQGDMEGAKVLFAQVIETDPSSEEGAQARATLDALP
jgi:tetratricopeptide (TPR) repeat protein